LVLEVAALAHLRAVVKDQVAVTVAAGGERHVADACARRIDASCVHRFAAAPGVQAQADRAEVFLDRTLAGSNVDAAVLPLPPRLRPVAERGGGDARVPARG